MFGLYCFLVLKFQEFRDEDAKRKIGAAGGLLAQNHEDTERLRRQLEELHALRSLAEVTTSAMRFSSGFCAMRWLRMPLMLIAS